MLVVLVDYHKGNIKSVERSLLDAAAELGLDVEVQISDAPDVVRAADAIVLPGVGAFTDAMETLDELGLSEVIKEAVDGGKGTPFLGICLGEHLMFEAGTEHAKDDGPTAGLGFLPGIVDIMPREDADGLRYKVPHVGWNSIEAPNSSGFSAPLLKDIPQGEHFYFTHSYIAPSCADVDAQADCADAADNYVAATTSHSVTFPSVVQCGRAFGVQFHPEKSSKAGLKLLSNFLQIIGTG